MLFNFRLRPFADIAPWHNADGSHPQLHWFGLTDGWYWIEAGSAELFRYSQPLVDKWKREHSSAAWLSALPYVDYQVVRLWEDVLDLLPAALDPVPPRLARVLGSDGTWTAWEHAATEAGKQALPEEEAWDLLEAAVGWWWERRLDTGYLQADPQIWLWSDDANAHIQWDNRNCILDGLPAWEALLGQHTMPVADFITEVRTFDARFVSRMHDRIAIVQTDWARPDVALDTNLGLEQSARAKWLSQRLDAHTAQEPTTWDAVFRAIASIEALPTFAPTAALP